MPRFRFQLQSLLEYREHIERMRQLAVARVEIERRESEGRIAGFQREIRAVKEDLRDRLAPVPASATSAATTASRAGGANVREARLQAVAALHLQMSAQREVIRLAGTHKRLELVRSELTKAAIDRRAMERLREKRLEAWRREQARKENAALEEMATQTAGRPTYPHGASHGTSPQAVDEASSPTTVSELDSRSPH